MKYDSSNEVLYKNMCLLDWKKMIIGYWLQIEQSNINRCGMSLILTDVFLEKLK